MATAVYIDGLNLYYGVAKPLEAKWVNIESFFRAQFPNEDIRKIYFFEAMVGGPSVSRQEKYVKALQTLPSVQVVLGQMKEKSRNCQCRLCTFGGDRSWKFFEEKHTDVSIAITMIDDAHRNGYDRMILVTADTDLVPAVRMAKIIRPQMKITLCMPAMSKYRIWGAKPVATLCDKVTRVDAELFLKHQFDPAFTDGNGTQHVIPSEWRIAPRDAAVVWKNRNPDEFLAVLPRWCN